MYRNIAIALLIAGFLLAIWFLSLGGYFSGSFFSPDKDKAREIQPFVTGLVVPLLTLGSTLLIFENLRRTTRQNFTTNFLKLIDHHHKLVDNIKSGVIGISTDKEPSRARDFFDDLAYRIAADYAILCDTITKPDYEIRANPEIKLTGNNAKENLMTIYEYYFHLYQSDIGHYFRNLYNIIRYAEESVPISVQRQHVKMLRAQLSNYEILMLAYNGMYEYGKKFHPLIEKFELLKNLNIEEKVPERWTRRIVDIQILKDNYPHFKKYHLND